jgi:hypothetical protein
MKYKNIIQKCKRNIYCIQISHQRYISAVIHTAVLNNVRKVCRLVLSRTPCIYLVISVSLFLASVPYALDTCIVVKKLCKLCCSFGLCRRVDSYVDSNVSEKHTVSFFSPEDGERMFLRNVGIYLWVYTAPGPRTSSSSLPWKPQVSHSVHVININVTSVLSLTQLIRFQFFVAGFLTNWDEI